MTRCTSSKWKWQLFPILDNLAYMRQSPNYGISFSFLFPMCATVETILLPHNINVSPREESKIQSVHLLPTTVLSSQQGGLKGQEGEALNRAIGIQKTPSSCTSYCTYSLKIDWNVLLLLCSLPKYSNTPLPLQNCYLFQLHPPL